MERKVLKQVTGYKTTDGAGVNLVRVLSRNTVEVFDPILMLDSFDSINPRDYIFIRIGVSKPFLIFIVEKWFIKIVSVMKI